ncbi:MAG: hypothetical protein JO121_29315, partial [Deltaproteobacteria bacterium]|nr:hypothetical protein [Deltaproteobacteria bacterium]
MSKIDKTPFRPQRTRLALALVVIALFDLTILFWTAPARAQDGAPNFQFSGQDPCLAGLPIPKPIPPAHRVVQLVNCSDQTVLGAANASGPPGQTPTSVFPREKTWVMKPYGSSNGENVLTIDIPPEWDNTKAKGSTGPNIWARTGC